MKKLSKEELSRRIDLARGNIQPELVIRGAKFLDVFSGQWVSGDIAIDHGIIVGVGEQYEGKKTQTVRDRWVVPGFIDSHVHVESSLMVPEEFERTVLPLGTTSAILDPHEIANVMGVDGIKYILECAEKSVMNIYVMLSSCVPATHLETSGASISAAELLPFKNHPHVLGLAEMMNYPGVLNKSPDVLDKLYEFQDVHIDGHAPLLRGKDLNAYLICGIKTCHESVGLKEAQEKLSKGMQVMLREGSVAKNLVTLCGALSDFSSPQISLATDDRNPADIAEEGHLDFLIRLAIKSGCSPASVYRAASWSTARCFGLRTKGAIAPGYDADLVILKDFKKCTVDKVIKAGAFVDVKKLGERRVPPPTQNSMKFELPSVQDIQVKGVVGIKNKVRVIEIVQGNIITKECKGELLADASGDLQSDVAKDILKIAVQERYGRGQKPATGFVKGMGLKSGAIGSSVGHDSHNAVSIGVNDEDILLCLERIKSLGGGFVVAQGGKIKAELSLPVGGLMSVDSSEKISQAIEKLRAQARKQGCELADPFLQMAFLCLAVIPDLKITDRGLVDVRTFNFVPVLVQS